MQDLYGDNTQLKTFTPHSPRDYGNGINIQKNFIYDPWENFDPLTNNYPAFANATQKARSSGIPDHVIERAYKDVERKLNFINKPNEVNAWLGRDQKSMERQEDYRRAKMFDAYKLQFPDKSNEDILDAFALSKFAGPDPEAILKYPELKKALMKDKEVHESITDAITNAYHADRIQNEIANLWIERMMGDKSPELMEQITQLNKEAEKYVPPLRPTLATRTARSASQLGTMMTASNTEGMAYGLTAATVAAAAGNAGPQALIPEEIVTVPVSYGIGYMMGSAWHIAKREAGAAMNEYMQMIDKNGQPLMDEDTATVAAIAVGSINALIEHLQMETIIKQFPGGEALLGKLSRNVVERIAQSPSIKQRLLDIVKGRAKDVGNEVFQEVTQEAVTIMGREITKAISDQPFASPDWENIIRQLEEVAIDTALGTAVIGAASGTIQAVTDISSSANTTQQAEQLPDYQTQLQNVAEELEMAPEDLQEAIQGAVDAVRNGTEQQEDTTEAPQPTEPETTVEEHHQEQEPQSVTQVQPEQETQAITPENVTQEEQEEYVFIPKKKFDEFQEQNKDVHVDNIMVDEEVGIPSKQFEILRENYPDFTNSIMADTRYGTNAKTFNEVSEKLNSTDPDKATYYHSRESQEKAQKIEERWKKAGEQEEEAKTFAEIYRVIDSNMMTSEGQGLADVKVRRDANTETYQPSTQRIGDPNYDPFNPATWLDRERGDAYMESVEWVQMTDLMQSTKDFANLILEKIPEKGKELKRQQDEILREVRKEVPDNPKRESSKYVRQELDEYKQDLSASNRDVLEELITNPNIDESRYDLNSVLPKGKRRVADEHYEFKDKFEVYDNSIIDIATDNDDLKVRVKTPDNKSDPFIFAIKNYKDTNLTQVLNDLLGGEISQQYTVRESPLGENIAQALDSFWSKNGLIKEEGVEATDPANMPAKARAQLDVDSSAWNETVDEILNDDSITTRSLKQVRVMHTPLVMTLVGAKHFPVNINNGKLKLILRDHKTMTPDILKQIPNAIANPISIFESASEGEHSARVILTELKDDNGASVLTAFHLDYKGDVNKLASSYAKENNGKAKNDWYASQVKNGRLLYVNTDKAAQWSAETGTQLVDPKKIPEGVKTQKDLIALWHDPNNAGYYYTSPEGEQLARTHLTEAGTAIVNLLRTGNFAVKIHELGHVTAELMSSLAESGSIRMNEDFETMLRNAGVTREEWRKDVRRKRGGAREKYQEYFARAWEIYWHEGKAPTKKLQGVFDRARKFLLDVYNDITTQLGMTINDEVRGVFDRFLVMDAEDTDTVGKAVEARSRIARQIKEYLQNLRYLYINKSQEKGMDIPPDLQGVMPRYQTVKTSAGTEVDTRFRVIEAKDLITSHSLTGRPNEAYLPELQNRDRSYSERTINQVREISQKLDPEQVAESRLASQGAPIIGPDRIVESGNARVLAILKAYNEKRGDDYKYWIFTHAQDFGVRAQVIQDMDAPVLVRERVTDDIDRVQFTREANVSDIAPMATAEKALNDAKTITPDKLAKFDTDKTFSNNKDFIYSVIQGLPENERGPLITKDGNDVSQEGYQRVLNALVAKAYEDSNIITSLTEYNIEGLKTLWKALIATAPHVAIFEAQKTNSIFSIKKELIDAIHTYIHLKENNETVDQFLTQREIDFGDAALKKNDTQNIPRNLVVFFEKNKSSWKNISTGLINYFQNAIKYDENTLDLFNQDIRVDKMEMLEHALNLQMNENEINQMFADMEKLVEDIANKTQTPEKSKELQDLEARLTKSQSGFAKLIDRTKVSMAELLKAIETPNNQKKLPKLIDKVYSAFDTVLQELDVMDSERAELFGGKLLEQKTQAEESSRKKLEKVLAKTRNVVDKMKLSMEATRAKDKEANQERLAQQRESLTSEANKRVAKAKEIIAEAKQNLTELQQEFDEYKASQEENIKQLLSAEKEKNKQLQRSEKKNVRLLRHYQQQLDAENEKHQKAIDKLKSTYEAQGVKLKELEERSKRVSKKNQQLLKSYQAELDKLEKSHAKEIARIQKEREKLIGQYEKQLGRNDKKLESKDKKIQQIQQRVENLKKFMNQRQENLNIKKTLQRIFKMAKSKNIILSSSRNIQDYLDGYNLDRKGIKEREKLHNLLMQEISDEDFNKRLNDEGFSQEDVQELFDKIHIEDMTLQDFRVLYENVKSMYEEGRRKYEQWLKDRNDRRLYIYRQLWYDLAKKDKSGKIVYRDRGDTVKQYTLGKVGETMDYYWTAVQTPGYFLDGLGPQFRRTFEDEPTRLRAKGVEQINRRQLAMLATMRELKLTPHQLYEIATSLDGQNYTWDQLMGIYAGMKNEKSAKAILWGNFVKTDVDDKKIYSTKEQGLAAINKLMDFFNQEENKPYKDLADAIMQDYNDEDNFNRLQEANEKYFNKPLNKEENYSRVFRLRHQSNQGLINADTENMGKSGNIRGMLDKIVDGFTISREEISEQHQQPIDLNLLANWGRAVEEQEFFIALGEYASDTMQALLLRGQNGSIREIIERNLGTPYWDTLASIFNDSIDDNVSKENKWFDKIAGHFVKARSITHIPGHLATMLAQTGSYIPGIAFTGHGHLFRSLGRFIEMGAQGRMNDFLEAVYQKAPELQRTGGDLIDRDTAQWLRTARVKNKYIRKAQGHTNRIIDWLYGGVRTLDNWTKSVLFDAVYRTRIQDGYSEEEAIKYANRAVHESQPASTHREAARMFRQGSAIQLAFTQFMGALAPQFNMTVVQLARTIQNPSKSAVKDTVWKWLGVGLSLLFVQVIKDGCAGRLPSGDERPDGRDDDWENFTEETLIDGAFSMIPVANRLISIARRMRGKTQFRSNDDKILEPFERLYKAGDYLLNPKYQGERKFDAFEEALRGGALIGIPIPYRAIEQFFPWFGLDDE